MMDSTDRASQNQDRERITVENMALLCSRNITPVQIPDVTIGQVGLQ